MRSFVLATAFASFTTFAGAQVVAVDPSFNTLVSASAKIEKLGSGMKFIEGPVWVKDHLIFSDIPSNKMMQWSPSGGVTVFRDQVFPGQYAPGQFIGSNGLTLDKEGRLISCEHGNRRVARTEKDGKITVLADRYQGSKLNSPNDAVVKSNGDIYFTDPPYGFPKEDNDPAKELKFNGVFRIHKGKLDLLIKGMTRPNGIAFTPDEKKMWVGNSDGEKKIWMIYDVAADGTLSNGKLFYDVTKEKADGLPDGLKVDKRGNLWATGPGGIWVFSPQGKLLGKIIAPEIPANCGWGDADGKTLYITARTGLYRIRTNVEGIHP